MPQRSAGGWAPYPGIELVQTLIVEAFGRLLPDMDVPGPPNGEEDLYSVFNARAELMGWSTTAKDRQRSLQWGMNDAGLTAGSEANAETDAIPFLARRMNDAGLTSGSAASRLGWVQVGLDAGVEPVVALPALVSCFHDALCRFGVVELSGLKVTGIDLSISGSSHLVSALNWFSVVPNARAGALVVIEDESLADRTADELVARLEWLNTGPFVFGRQMSVPDRHSGDAPGDVVPSPGRLGLSVTLPEWTAAAAAWALATVVDQTGASGSGRRTLTARVEVSPRRP